MEPERPPYSTPPLAKHVFLFSEGEEGAVPILSKHGADKPGQAWLPGRQMGLQRQGPSQDHPGGHSGQKARFKVTIGTASKVLHTVEAPTGERERKGRN